MRISIDGPEKPIERTEDSIEREAVKKTFKGEKKKLSQMKFTEKIKYIWSYYKYQIIGIAVGILLVGYIIYFTTTRKTPVLTGIILNDSALNTEQVAADLGEYLELTEKQEVDLLDEVYLSATGSATNMSGTNQVLSLVLAKELDFVICDEDGLDYMLENELCWDPRDYMTDEADEVFADRYVTEDDWEYPVAIDISGMQITEDLGCTYDEVYLVITSLSGHDDLVTGFLSYIAGLE